jgi:hypothetical protein
VPDFGVKVRSMENHARRTQNDRHLIVGLVSDTPGEPAHGLHSVGSSDAIFRHATFRDVHADSGHVADLPCFVAPDLPLISNPASLSAGQDDPKLVVQIATFGEGLPHGVVDRCAIVRVDSLYEILIS